MATFTPQKLIKFGTKQVFLPKFTLTLLRPPPNSQLSPYHARFLVPLDLGKLDLRDYLYHAYGIKTTNIRSFVEQQKVKVDNEEDGTRRYRRPRAKKYMTVEMDRPFVWPEYPENWEPWGGAPPRGVEGQVKNEKGERLREGGRKMIDWERDGEAESTLRLRRMQGEALRKQAQAVKERNGQLGPKISFLQANKGDMKVKV
ncbi:hypothetical protein GQ43DRAFT_444755 [Delitschia confertaspora ATCC 74209]|uniref:Large ribosomal subunit protein uL23m n=1 Tax=Delitschia confertaspora ATCC 74209 TaxID=1513339 RepID=A0A9P4JCM0_9PLEO|nr:hypothetical protein GQ43DRAFT_444755 [Delitschia confertaspora ATCC 74209]